MSEREEGVPLTIASSQELLLLAQWAGKESAGFFGASSDHVALRLMATPGFIKAADDGLRMIRAQRTASTTKHYEAIREADKRYDNEATALAKELVAKFLERPSP